MSCVKINLIKIKIQMCGDKAQCILTVSKSTNGDPCLFASYKHTLEVAYECIVRFTTARLTRQNMLASS